MFVECSRVKTHSNEPQELFYISLARLFSPSTYFYYMSPFLVTNIHFQKSLIKQKIKIGSNGFEFFNIHVC
jgi:hypothetical protein